MGKMDKHIMVVPVSDLFSLGGYFQGFRSHHEFDYESTVLSNHLHMRRGDAEEDHGHKQPIGYTFIVNPGERKVFVYERSSSDQDYGERRLQGKLSMGVGGHIEPMDGAKNSIYESMLREVGEEVEIVGHVLNIHMFGYINDDEDDVGKVHFGVAYIVETNATEVRPRDSEMKKGMLVSVDELESMVESSEAELEGWSRIGLPAIKQYFSQL